MLLNSTGSRFESSFHHSKYFNSVLDMSSVTSVVGAFGLKPKLVQRSRNVVGDDDELDAFPQFVFYMPVYQARNSCHME